MNSSNSRFVPAKCLVAVLLAAVAWQVRADSPGLAVGSVTLSLGKAVIINANGQSSAVRKGSQIHPGDRVETAEGGHVHIRFVDGALVSVRPTSRLEVEDYQYNAQQVEKSLVRFRLDQGVARAISGAAAEGARERFRLNTPLVAIGVRGTDFVVRADARQTLASVNQGAIVMAPFGDGCQVQATGPCSSGTARLLTAAMGNMLVEYRDHFAQPEIKPLNTMLAGESGGQTVAASASRVSPDQQLLRESRKSDDTVTMVLLQTGGQQVDSVIKTDTKPPTVPTGIVQPVFVPSEADQLVWGRFSGTAAVMNDISVGPGSALVKGKTAAVTDDRYVLYQAQGRSDVLLSQQGTLNFALQQSQASFTAASGAVQAASVLGGSLQINFGSQQFSTVLSVSSVPTGVVGVQAAGVFGPNTGIFYTADELSTVVKGAVSWDAKSAGYFFQKAAAGGSLSGITLWGK